MKVSYIAHLYVKIAINVASKKPQSNVSDKMKIIMTIQMEEDGKNFSVTSRPHESITKALCEIGAMAEDHRRMIKRGRRY
jgi:hypothetical protein